jgi:ElaB/YqjD/DUF883 family membrane-anchored ribosome-binding protein
MANSKSPAVNSLPNEQSLQRLDPDPLQEGPEDTSPASDPVSATGNSFPAGATSVNRNEDTVSDAPRVDEALEAILENRNNPYVETREHVAAARDQIDSIRDRTAADIRSRIRNNPWQAVGIAALAGFLFGLTR